MTQPTLHSLVTGHTFIESFPTHFALEFNQTLLLGATLPIRKPRHPWQMWSCSGGVSTPCISLKLANSKRYSWEIFWHRLRHEDQMPCQDFAHSTWRTTLDLSYVNPPNDETVSPGALELIWTLFYVWRLIECPVASVGEAWQIETFTSNKKLEV